MRETEEPLFVEIIAVHRDCPLLFLKENYKDSIREATVQGVVRRSSPKHVVSLSVKTRDLKDICSTIKKESERLELLDVLIRPERPEESQVYCYVTDDLLNIFSQVEGGTFWIPEYRLHEYYLPFNRSAEYLHSFIPSREFFLSHLRELRGALEKEEGKIKVQYRFHHGIEKRRIASLTIQEQYIVERILETDYLENYDKKELKCLAEELQQNLDSTDQMVQDLCASVYVMGAMVYLNR